jgi:hypothetical protein
MAPFPFVPITGQSNIIALICHGGLQPGHPRLRHDADDVVACSQLGMDKSSGGVHNPAGQKARLAVLQLQQDES